MDRPSYATSFHCRRSSPLIVVAIALSLILVGCGNGESADVAADEPAPSDDGTESEDMSEYTVFGLVDHSGVFAHRGAPAEDIQRLLVDWFNEDRGQELGVRVKFESADSGYDPAQSTAAYERALDSYSDLVGVTTFGGPELVGVQERTRGDEIPVAHGSTAVDLMQPGGWVVAPIGEFTAMFLAAIDYFAEGASEPLDVALATFDGTTGLEWSGRVAEGLDARSDADLVQEEIISPAATEVSVNVSRLVAADPDVLIVSLTDQLQPMMLEGLHESGFDMTRVLNAPHESLEFMFERTGLPLEIMEGQWESSTMNYVDTESEAYRLFHDRADQYDTRWATDTLPFFAAMMVMLDAIEIVAQEGGADSVTGAAIRDAWLSNTFDGRGLLTDIEFSEEDPLLGARTTFLLQLLDGEIGVHEEITLE